MSTVSADFPAEDLEKDFFPTKVIELLAMNHEVFSWLPHGRAIKVHDERRFLDELAPKFFKISKFRSFTRQLHLWGFRRISFGVDVDGWWNPQFLRGRPDLLSKMVRIKVKGSGKTKRNVVMAPNFYAMPYCLDADDGKVTARAPACEKYDPMPPLNPGRGTLNSGRQVGDRGQAAAPRRVSTVKADPGPPAVHFSYKVGCGDITNIGLDVEAEARYDDRLLLPPLEKGTGTEEPNFGAMSFGALPADPSEDSDDAPSSTGHGSTVYVSQISQSSSMELGNEAAPKIAPITSANAFRPSYTPDPSYTPNAPEASTTTFRPIGSSPDQEHESTSGLSRISRSPPVGNEVHNADPTYDPLSYLDAAYASTFRLIGEDEDEFSAFIGKTIQFP